MKLLMTRLSRLMAALTLTAVSSYAVDIVLLDDTFAGENRISQDLPGSAAWYSATGSETVVHDPEADTLTLLEAPSSSRHIVAYFTDEGPVTLQPGESIRLEYDITFTNPNPNTAASSSNSFRAGLFNSDLVGTGVERVNEDNLGGVATTNTPSYYDSYVGYRFDNILHTNTSSLPARIFRRNADPNGRSLIATTTAYTGALAAEGPTVLFVTGLYYGEGRITREEDGSVSFSHSLVSAETGVEIGLSVSGSDPNPEAVYAYDTVAFALNSRVAESFSLHRVRVVLEALDPEPLLDESFTAADRTIQDLPDSAAWFSATAADTVVHDAEAGELTLLAAAGSSRHILAYFTEEGEPVELEPGDVLRLRYDMTFVNPDPNTAGTTSNSFRIGLFDSRLEGTGKLRIDADGHGGVSTNSPPGHFDTYVGYRFDTIPHTSTTSPPMRVYRRNAGFENSALIVISTAYSSVLAETESDPVLFQSGLYHGVVEITGQLGGGVTFSHRLVSAEEGVEIDMSVSGMDTSEDAVASFDTIVFGLNSRVAEAITLHNVKVTHIEAVDTGPLMLELGGRVFEVESMTSKGIPVVPMWNAPMPTTDRSTGAGFPVLEEADHAYVWRPANATEGGYNHYAALFEHNGRFYVMWGNHSLGEDAPGQRVLYAYSDEWGVWSDAIELFAAPGPVKPRSEDGIHLKADRWIVADDKLYAVVYVHGAGRYPIAREVEADGSLGDPFLVRNLPSGAEYPVYMTGYVHTTEKAQIATKLRVWYVANNHVSWWAQSGEGAPGTSIDDATLIEPFSYRAKDGGYVLFMRNWGTSSNPVHNNRLYVSFSNSLARWSTPYPTDIPDSPSRAQALSLDDGRVLLIGNQNAPVFDTALYLDRDPITVAISDDGLTFDRVFALRTDAPRSWQIPGIGGRNYGYAYSSSIISDGWLYTSYSIGKEDMGISRVPLAAMGIIVEVDTALYGGAEAIADGWYVSPWFGTFWDGAYPFVYSTDMEWLYVYGIGEGLAYAHHDQLGWIYVDQAIYPWIWEFETEAWSWVATE